MVSGQLRWQNVYLVNETLGLLEVKGPRNRGRPKRSWEEDVEDWMGAIVWRLGRTVEVRLVYGRSVKAATSGNG